MADFGIGDAMAMMQVMCAHGLHPANCPICSLMPYPQTQWMMPFMPVLIGCICPPGANRECERIDCPRKKTSG
jgi:hypothetical protein